MDKRILQSYSVWAKDNLENQIEVSLKALGINNENDIRSAKKMGDITMIDGDPTSYPADLYSKREDIISLIGRRGYRNIIEEFAYTWFNRFVAIRFMEVHGFLSHGFRVLSNPSGGIEPEILKNLNLVKDELRLNMNLCSEYKRQGKIEELFRYVLIKQCDSLSKILPMLFSADLGYLELLLPKTLLKGETVVTKLIEIPEEAFLEDVEIIGWMYQFYISAKKDAVYAAKKTITKDTLPAVTQLFTPDWIVRYMAENSVGRLWLESYPDSSLRSLMQYYVPEAEQTKEVQKKIDEIRYKNVNPEEIRIIEPCCGSGHILCYVFDLLFKMYDERGYQKRQIPTLILKNNLIGLDVDKRAAQLSSFALVMKARAVNNRFFTDEYYEEPHVYELQDSELLEKQGYRKKMRDLQILSDEEMKLIIDLADTFKNGKTIGSLMKVKPMDFACLDTALEKLSRDAVAGLFNTDFLSDGVKRLKELSRQAKILSAKYDVMITNPPYRPISSMEAAVKDYAVKNYPDSKADMFAMFMETGFVKPNGFMAMINMHSWMFISTYEQLRTTIYTSKSLLTMAHLGARGFNSIPGEVVQTTAFVIRETFVSNYCGVYFRLVKGKNEAEKEKTLLNRENKYCARVENFSAIAGEPMAYWASAKMLSAFETGTAIGKLGIARNGMKTGDNSKFVRMWWEPSLLEENFKANNYSEAISSNSKWFPYNKGGLFRKWYGNNDCVVDWQYGGKAVIGRAKADRRHVQDYPDELKFKPALTWSLIATNSPSFRYKNHHISDIAGMSVYTEKANVIKIMGVLNSKVAKAILELLAPTINFQAGDIARVPMTTVPDKEVDLVQKSIHLSKLDWDAFETSWDFKTHPFISLKADGLINSAFQLWKNECENRFSQLKSNEEELNRIFIDIYGLQDELVPEENDEDVTVRLADKERDVRSFISYLIGVAMGRYSLDAPGLAYAGGDWDDSKYVSYHPDDDGIIPIYNTIGMEDGLTTVLIRLIKQIYGEDTYRQNIDFIAEALGKNTNESSEETLNRYLNDDFYADHLKIYQKRPIYWLFTSGKKAGFKCLIYMHRYNEDTLARINGKYFLPESTRKKNELDELNGRIARAEGRDKIKLEKRRQNLAAAYNEAIEYGQVLDHMANRYISIDLDDGVKVNYAKFQGIEIVTDSGSKVKKDLLSPLK